MITGFNTDVEYRGVIFHVQTEDKGVSNPVIESLIYRGGEILGARRLPYSNILQDGYNQKAVIRLMEEQHRAMIEEVRHGKYDKSGDLLNEDALISDQSLDQVILNYLASNKKDADKP